MASSETITRGRISIHVAGHLVLWNGRPIKALAPKEFELLRVLVSEAPKVLDKSALAVKVWGTASEKLHPHTIYEHVRRIRKKLGPAAVCFKTVSGLGLQWLDKSAYPTPI